jgi:hypothetical protein
MTTKTTNTNNNAGVPPAPPEAHQRAGGAIRIAREDVAVLAAMLKNPAPTIRKAAAEMLAQLRTSGVELAFVETVGSKNMYAI